MKKRKNVAGEQARQNCLSGRLNTPVLITRCLIFRTYLKYSFAFILWKKRNLLMQVKSRDWKGDSFISGPKWMALLWHSLRTEEEITWGMFWLHELVTVTWTKPVQFTRNNMILQNKTTPRRYYVIDRGMLCPDFLCCKQFYSSWGQAFPSIEDLLNYLLLNHASVFQILF